MTVPLACEGNHYHVTLFDVTLPSPAENLALDEALLDESEASRTPLEALRLWESPSYFVVIGSSGKLREEVCLAACERDRLPILRRHSGGGAVVQGPGCLNFSLILSLESRQHLRDIHESFRFILGKVRSGLKVSGLAMNGTSDLSIDGRKVSGNAQRRRQCNLLHQGTLLYNFDPQIIGKYLTHPPKEPDYRRRRKHEDFVTNLPLSAATIKSRIAEVWEARPSADRAVPRLVELVREKYANPNWIHRL